MPAWPGPARRRDLALVAVAAVAAVLLRGSVAEPHLVRSGAMAPALRPGDVLVVSRLAYALRLPFSAVTVGTLATPARGDVVIFPDPSDPARRLASRVVGLPGEVVELREQVLLVDGVPQARLDLGPHRSVEPGEGGQAPRDETCRRWREHLEAGPVPAVDAPGAGAAPPAGGPGAGAGPRPTRAHDVLQCRRVRAGRREGPFGPVRPGHLFVLGDNRDRSEDSRAGWEVPVAQVVGRGTLVVWSWGAGGWWPGGGAGVRMDRLFKPVE